MEENNYKNAGEERITEGLNESDKSVAKEIQPTDISTATTVINEVDEDIKALENGPQKHPGSNGAFPVGAFDTSKPD